MCSPKCKRENHHKMTDDELKAALEDDKIRTALLEAVNTGHWAEWCKALREIRQTTWKPRT